LGAQKQGVQWTSWDSNIVFFGQLGSLFPLEPLQMDQWDFEAVLLRPQYLLLMEGLYIAAIATFLALRQNLQLERKEELWDSWAV
jgi:hypothetical protein